MVQALIHLLGDPFINECRAEPHGAQDQVRITNIFGAGPPGIANSEELLAKLIYVGRFQIRGHAKISLLSTAP
jgi:hypothetical protein